MAVYRRLRLLSSAAWDQLQNPTLVSNMGLRLPLPAINEQFFTVAVFNVSSNLLIFVIIQSNTTTVYNHLQRNSRHIR